MTNIFHSDSDQKALEALFSQEMTRKQFLLYIATAIVGMIGIRSFLNSLLQRPETNHKNITNDAYGGGSYSTRPQKSFSGGRH